MQQPLLAYNAAEKKGITNFQLFSYKDEVLSRGRALCAAREMAAEKPKNMVLVYLYNSARTYFIKNS
jgi:hypothetical protein